MSDQRVATALRIALLRERAEQVACRIAQSALESARSHLEAHQSPESGYGESADGAQLVAAYTAAAGRAATVLAAERAVADADGQLSEARASWTRSAQRRQALEEASRRVEATRRAERDRSDQRALDDNAGRRRSRR
jgi:hypothetical protein